MAEIYCHGKTLLNALRAVWLEVGKALFGQATTGRKTLAAWMLGARRPATMMAPSAGSHGLLGVDVIRTKGGKAPFSENGLCVLNGWGGCGHLLLVLC